VSGTRANRKRLTVPTTLHSILSAKPLKGSGPSRHWGNARGMPELWRGGGGGGHTPHQEMKIAGPGRSNHSTAQHGGAGQGRKQICESTNACLLHLGNQLNSTERGRL
jgi:hypothetical protein